MFVCLLAFYTIGERLDLVLPYALMPAYLPRLATFFFGGAVLYLWRDKVPVRGSVFTVAALALAILPGWRYWTTLVLPIAGVYCMFYLGSKEHKILNAIGRKNDLSYGIYLYGWPIQQLVVQYLGCSGHPWRVTGITLPIAALVAAASWVLIERPAMKLKWPAQWHARRLSGVGDDALASPIAEPGR